MGVVVGSVCGDVAAIEAATALGQHLLGLLMVSHSRRMSALRFNSPLKKALPASQTASVSQICVD